MKVKKEDAKKKMLSYTKYSGLAYQLIGMLAVSIWLGMKADAYLGNKNQYITAVSCLLVLFAFFYKIFNMVSKEGNAENNN